MGHQKCAWLVRFFSELCNARYNIRKLSSRRNFWTVQKNSVQYRQGSKNRNCLKIGQNYGSCQTLCIECVYMYFSTAILVFLEPVKNGLQYTIGFLGLGLENWKFWKFSEFLFEFKFFFQAFKSKNCLQIKFHWPQKPLKISFPDQQTVAKLQTKIFCFAEYIFWGSSSLSVFFMFVVC